MKFTGEKSVSSFLRVLCLISAFCAGFVTFFTGFMNQWDKSLHLEDTAVFIQLDSAFITLGTKVPLIMMWLMITISCYQLYQVFQNLSFGMVFVYENVKHLRILAGVQVLGSIFQSIFEYLNGKALYSILQGKGLNVTLQFQVGDGIIIGALMIFVLAEVMNEAIKIKEDSDLTV